MSRETSLVSTAFSAGFAPDDFAQFAQLSGTYRTQLAQIEPFLDPRSATSTRHWPGSAAWGQLATAEVAIVKHGPWSPGDQNSVPVTETDWQNATNQVAQGLNDLAITQADKVSRGRDRLR